MALVKLLNLIPVKELTIDRKIHKTRCDISSKTIGEKTERYNLRHTVLAQRVASERVSHKIVAQEAGHTTIRMIDENYGKKFIKEEEFARKNKIGMWAMEFEFPWDYRKNKSKRTVS